MSEKSDRKLRNIPRKDYAKMANVNGELSDEREPGVSDGHDVNKNKNGGDGEIVNKEFVLSDDDNGGLSNSDPDSDEAESSDEDVLSAREQLKALKRMQKDLNKEAKLQKIAQETDNVRRSIEKLSSSSGRKKDRKNVNIASGWMMW